MLLHVVNFNKVHQTKLNKTSSTGESARKKKSKQWFRLIYTFTVFQPYKTVLNHFGVYVFLIIVLQFFTMEFTDIFYSVLSDYHL